MSMQQAIAGANVKCDAECATPARTDTRRYMVAIMHAVWLVTRFKESHDPITELQTFNKDSSINKLTAYKRGIPSS